jgi:crotonobetaine/carnitine-CoA ligase
MIDPVRHSIESDLRYDSRTLPAIWQERATVGGDRPCLWFPGRAQETWASLDRRVLSVARGLHARRLEAGSRVCLLMQNSPEMIVALLALWRLGLVAVPLSPQLSGELLAERLRSVEAELMILDAGLHEQLPDEWRQAEEDGRLLLNRLDDSGRSSLEAGDGADAELPAIAVRPTDPALILFTSGTSGFAKGCLLSHHYATYYGWVFWRYMGYGEDDTLYTCLPLNHCHALFASWWASVLAGGRLALSERFSASRYWQEIVYSEATVCAAIGMMTSILLAQPESEWESRLAVRLAHVSAEGALTMPEFERRFGVKAVTSRYGSTEAMVFPPAVGLPPVPGLIGPAPSDWDVATLDGDGRPVEEGAGELAVRPRIANIMFDRYVNAPEATVDAFRGLWFHTGDLVRRDASGLYWFVGRATDTIRRRGENISPSEVERAVGQQPAVAEVAAFALPSALGGDDLCLVAVPRDGSELTGNELTRHCEEVLPRYMRPDRVWVRRSELPKTSSNKVDKAALRIEYGETPESGPVMTGEDARATAPAAAGPPASPA